METGTSLPNILSPYRGILGYLRVEKGLILDGDRLVVPQLARHRIIDLLHTSHSGITNTSQLARQLYVWPGMINEIRLKIANCRDCIHVLPSLPMEPLYSAATTVHHAMQSVSVDLFELGGQHFLVMVDRFSGFPFVDHLKKSITTSYICNVLLHWFWDYGFPEHLKSDNGPQFRDQFGISCSSFAITHSTSSPYHPQSNGLAEAAVKSMKTLIRKVGTEDHAFHTALLTWRNTPRAHGFSPAAGFFGRHLRVGLPDARNPMINLSNFRAARLNAEAIATESAGGSILHPLHEGDQVHYQLNPFISRKWRIGGVVRECLSGGRSYIIDTPDGAFRLNHRLLRLAALCQEPQTSKVKMSRDLTVHKPIIVPRRSSRIAARKDRVWPSQKHHNTPHHSHSSVQINQINHRHSFFVNNAILRLLRTKNRHRDLRDLHVQFSKSLPTYK